jgi:hypothetical protein
VPAEDSPLRLTVHSLPEPQLDDAARRTTTGRLKMLLVLLVCALPVIASYLTYYVIRPGARSNYSDLILPARALPAGLDLVDMNGKRVAAPSLHGQWLLVVVAGGACDPGCERSLWLQRQLRETLGRERDRVDKVWLIPDAQSPAPGLLDAINSGATTNVLRVPREALQQWLEPGNGGRLEQHVFIVDPLGNWMMRAPPDPDPAKLKRDLDRLLRASAGWDKPGR